MDANRIGDGTVKVALEKLVRHYLIIISEFRLTLEEHFGISLKHLLRSEVITVLVLVLSHSIPNWLGFRRFDQSYRSFEKSSSV